MITVPEATEKVIKRSRYLSEALSKDLINISSLARYIKPEIEEMLLKKVSVSAIIMAIKRLSKNLDTPTSFQNLFSKQPIMTVQTGGEFASVTITLEEAHRETPGVFYFFLKSLAWERINIVSITSKENALVITVSDRDVNRTFGVLKSLFSTD